MKVDIKNGLSYETHKDYIENFGKKFYESVKNLIDKNALKKNFIDDFNENDKDLLHEILRHARFSKDYVQKFHGRVNLLEKVKPKLN